MKKQSSNPNKCCNYYYSTNKELQLIKSLRDLLDNIKFINMSKKIISMKRFQIERKMRGTYFWSNENQLSELRKTSRITFTTTHYSPGEQIIRTIKNWTSVLQKPYASN